jgi:outer membrane receptor protein involved in Fe transport
MKHKLRSLLFFLFASLPLFSAAQLSAIRLKGSVFDNTTGVGVAYATAVLFKNDTVRVSATQSNERGDFFFNGLRAGPYRLDVSFIGYQKFSQWITLKPGQQDSFMKISLGKSAVSLSEVQVAGKRSLITSFGGGFKFNPKDASINRTGSAVDLLGQIPGVLVEDNNDIKLKGNTVKVMVNGKLINLSGQELQNYLKAIPAERIVNVTVNTNPSSKYDASTNGGLIDIQLKNKFEQGLYGSVSAKAESLPGTWDAINADYTKNKFTLSLGLTYLYRKDRYLRENEIVNKQGPDANYFNTQNATMPQKQELLNPRVEVNYTIDSTSFVNVSVNFPVFSHNFPVMLRSDNRDREGNPVNYFLQNETVNYRGNYYTYNGNYVKNFKKQGEQLSFGGVYTKTVFNPKNSYTRDYFDLTGAPDTSESMLVRSNSNRLYRSSQLQADYVLPMAKDKKLSLGVKNSYSLIDTDDPVDYYDRGQQRFIRNILLSNALHYKENITAGYLIFNKDFKKWSYSLGTRYEYSSIDIRSAGSARYSQHYGNLFPNLSFTYRISDFQSLDFSAARKIDRPPYSYLDPFVNTNDVNNYAVGNPNLRPSYINSLELQYSKQWSNTQSAILTLSYSGKNNIYSYPITTFSPLYDHVVTTYINATDTKALTLSLIGNNKLTEWWQVNSYAGISVSSLKTDSIANTYYKPKPYFNGSLTNTFTLSKKSVIRLTGFFNTTSYQYQAKLNGFGSINIGYQRSMLDKKLTLNLDAYDLFKTRKYTYTVNSNSYYARSFTTIKSRYIALALTYAFGKSGKKPAVKKLNNERIDI